MQFRRLHHHARLWKLRYFSRLGRCDQHGRPPGHHYRLKHFLRPKPGSVRLSTQTEAQVKATYSRLYGNCENSRTYVTVIVLGGNSKSVRAGTSRNAVEVNTIGARERRTISQTWLLAGIAFEYHAGWRMTGSSKNKLGRYSSIPHNGSLEENRRVDAFFKHERVAGTDRDMRCGADYGRQKQNHR